MMVEIFLICWNCWEGKEIWMMRLRCFYTRKWEVESTQHGRLWNRVGYLWAIWIMSDMSQGAVGSEENGPKHVCTVLTVCTYWSTYLCSRSISDRSSFLIYLANIIFTISTMIFVEFRIPVNVAFKNIILLCTEIPFPLFINYIQ